MEKYYVTPRGNAFLNVTSSLVKDAIQQSFEALQKIDALQLASSALVAGTDPVEDKEIDCSDVNVSITVSGFKLPLASKFFYNKSSVTLDENSTFDVTNHCNVSLKLSDGEEDAPHIIFGLDTKMNIHDGFGNTTTMQKAAGYCRSTDGWVPFFSEEFYIDKAADSEAVESFSAHYSNPDLCFDGAI